MGTYLKGFSERVGDVPGYLRRHLALIRDLDEKAVQLQQEIEQCSKRRLVKDAELLGGKKSRVAVDSPAPYDVDSAMTRLLSLADEKVNIAAQVYDFIDRHIQHLDEDLQALAQEIQNDKERLGLQEDDTACDQLGIELTKRGHKRKSAAADNTGKEKKRKGKRKAVEEEAEDEVPVPVVAGEHEPLYCYCQRPSHGNMVACDNDECQHEWFHYECVGLTEEPPKDQPWYCPDCAKLMKQRKGLATGGKLR